MNTDMNMRVHVHGLLLRALQTEVTISSNTENIRKQTVRLWYFLCQATVCSLQPRICISIPQDSLRGWSVSWGNYKSQLQKPLLSLLKPSSDTQTVVLPDSHSSSIHPAQPESLTASATFLSIDIRSKLETDDTV